MVKLLFLFISESEKYNENAVFELKDWDTFLRLMKIELIDKELGDEAQSKLNFTY